MSEIVEFVRARIDEDEELAREVEDQARHDRGRLSADEAGAVTVTGVARVLADCEAKRGLLELAEAATADDLPGYATAIRQLLALPYADHADYLDAWRP
jgi:Family of unknown function (DUF6221)